ncbi:MAG TPA: TetR/AcrR family transcriptional regulator [Steroidobacter sp.]|uniref:TetR/AcrR family transcriptional regulator n=1 Tax=Steroidobacter sp. TaxID=1978227 RepID=UPI002ED8DE50
MSERVPQVRGLAVREKILSMADELFYREGLRAVGVDTLIAESGVAKTTLYRWFPSKDALIAAFLERRNAQFWAQWDRIAAKHKEDPRAELDAQLGWIARYVSGPKYRGCPFINAAAELPDLAHPGREVCIANKQKLSERLLKLCTQARVKEPRLLADQLLLLIDGAFANAQVLGKSGPASLLAAAGKALIDAAVPRRR